MISYTNQHHISFIPQITSSHILQSFLYTQHLFLNIFITTSSRLIMEIITEVEHQPWEQEEEDEDELDEGLVTRKKNLNQTTIDVGVTNYHHHQQQQEDVEEEEEEVKDFIQPNDTKVDEDENKKDKHHISDFCVYYDTDKENISFKNNNEESKNVNGVQNGEHKKHEIFIEGDRSATSSYINNKSEINGNEVIKDGEDDEITEYDVETVIKKQETHDLFCPNCNSCITKRVILRKRKRRIRVHDEDSKRNKSQTLISSELNGVDSRLDDVQPLASNEYDNQQEPDVFRCLSCFSIFMPTGNGFRLFKMFGNKSNEENIEHSHKEVSEKKSWFLKFLRSEKVDDDVTNLNDSGGVKSLDVKKNENVVGISSVSSNWNSSMQESNSHTSNGVMNLEKNQLQLNKDTRESNGKKETESIIAETQEQLLTSYHLEKESNKSLYPGMFVVEPPSSNNMESTDSSISPLQHDGLKLLVPPNVGSLIIDNSHMNQELDITVQTSSTDENGWSNLSISPTQAGQTNGLGLPIHIAINGKEHKLDTDSVQPTDIMLEGSQQIIQNNVEIHLEEPLKVDTNVLTDNKQINILANVKNIESINGKDAIITIESKQLDASVIQRTTGESGTPVLQPVVEQGRVNILTSGGRSVEIIKSIVYGGLIELIASLSVVSSAVGGDAATLNVLALGLANIFGGLFVISHDLWDLKNERTRKTDDRYQQLLGQRTNFPLHMTISLISYLIFGFLPPIVYGFSFHKSNDKDLKLLMVAATSIVCIMILAAGKAYVQRPRKSYFKTIGYHVVLGFMVSGVSFVLGGLIVKLLEKIDVFDDGSAEKLRVYGVSSNSALATF